MSQLILAMDQGTSSCRSVIIDAAGDIRSRAQQELTIRFPKPGWVEHDAQEIWSLQLSTARAALQLCGADGKDVAAIGITNQRETVVVWDRRTGVPIHAALVWQDRRTTDVMQQLVADGQTDFVQQRSGLVLDPYFSASKLAWVLDHVPQARARAERGELAAGTIDAWLVWQLTGGRVHVTDVSNASRTMLMSLRTLDWDDELLDLLRVPRAVLPRIVDSSGVCGESDAALFGASIPIAGICGDQQSALFGQGCTERGQAKITYGTGCFLLVGTGSEVVMSRSRLLTTVAWRLREQPAMFALEGSVFMGGAAVQWLRDGLRIIRTASEVNELAAQVADCAGVMMVPAFTGLGAPHWDPTARACVLGMTRGTSAAHLARATLEGIALQVCDVVEAMETDLGSRLRMLRVDGGACASDLLMQSQSNFLDAVVERPRQLETTVMGAAFLAGLGVGVWKRVSDVTALRSVDQTFTPLLDRTIRVTMRHQWRRAVECAKGWQA